jgi:hypothetical protein
MGSSRTSLPIVETQMLTHNHRLFKVDKDILFSTNLMVGQYEIKDGSQQKKVTEK